MDQEAKKHTVRLKLAAEVEYAASLCEKHAMNWKMMADTGKHRVLGQDPKETQKLCRDNAKAMTFAANMIRAAVSGYIDERMKELLSDKVVLEKVEIPVEDPPGPIVTPSGAPA